MATKLGTLTLDMVTRIGNFIGPMRQAENQATSSANSIVESFDVASLAAKAFGAVVAGVSVGVMVAFVNQTIDTGNEIKKLSQLANASVHDFQYYAKGAETAGIGMEQFADQMKDMQDRIGDFQQTGGGPLADFFEKIAPRVGVTIQQFQKLSGPEALQLYYNSLEKVNASQNDMKFYLEAVISDSSLFIPLLKNGGEGFKKWGDAAERANAIMSDDMIENLALAKENIQLLNLQWEGTKNALINSAVPAIEATINNLDALTNMAMVGAAFMAGTYIPTIYGSITAGYARTKQMLEQNAVQVAAINTERAAAASALVQAQAQFVNTESTLTALAAEKALEVQRLQAQINAAGRMASTTRMAQLRQIEVQVTAELTAAETALAAARTRSTAAAAANIGIGRTALSVLGGPVGIGVTLAAVTAGYLLMRDGTEKATASINIQGQSVDDLIKKYRELNTLQRDNESKALADQVEDLSLKYRVALSDLHVFMQALPISNDKLATFSKLNSQLSLGKISTDSYYTAVKNVNILTGEQLNQVRQLIGGYSEAKTKFYEAETAQKALKTAMSNTTQHAKEQAAEVRGLSAEIIKLLADANKNIGTSQISTALASRGYSDDLITLTQKYLAVEGAIIKNDQGRSILRPELQKSLNAEYAAILKQKNAIDQRNEAEKKTEDLQKKRTDELKKQNEEAAKKYQYTVKEEDMLRRVAELASKNGLNAIGAKYGIPENLLAAVMAQESKGNVNAKSSTGAIGPFQTTGIYRKNYGLSVKDSYDVKKSGDIAGKDLAASFKIFGNWTDAVTAYNAGVSGTQSLLKNGFTGSAAKSKEAKEYAGKVNKWFVGLNGSDAKDSGFYGEKQSESLKDYQTFLDKTEQLRVEALARQVAIVQTYADEEQQIHRENAEAIQSIQEAFTVDDSNRQKYLELQKIVYQKDLEEFKKNQEAKRIAVYNSLNDPIYSMQSKGLEATAKVSMNPMQYQAWQLNNEQQDGYSALSDDLGLARNGINDNELLSAQEKYSQLENAYDIYLQNKAALDAQYDEQVKSLSQSQYESQLSIWGSLLGQAQNTWSQMTQAVKDSEGEQSGSFKAMFLMQQAMAFGSAIVSAHLAAVQTTADITLPFVGKIPAASAILAFGYANAGIIAGQAIAGMAHDGIDNIPREGTWLLDGGERVLNPNQNKDLTNYLSQAQSNNTQAAPNVNLNPNFVIVDERQSLGDYLYGPDGKKAFVKFFKQNRRELGFA